MGTGGPRDASAGHVFQLLASPDLVQWRSLGYAMEKLPGRSASAYWAPEVAFLDGRWFLYYSVGEGDRGHQIRVAESRLPQGPYVDRGPLTAESLAFAIDPHVFVDVDGQSYLYFATDLLDGDRPGTSLVVQRMHSPTALEGSPTVVARATQDWQRYEAGRSIYGRILDWHTLEGPAVVRRDGRLTVFYSGGNWQKESYGVDFVTGDHPLGPYEDDSPGVPRVLRSSPSVLGPGHNSLVESPDRRRWMAVYHGWDPARTARLMRIDPIVWTANGPVVDGPTVGDRVV